METKFKSSKKNNFSAPMSDLKLAYSFNEQINLVNNTPFLFILLFMLFSSLASFSQNSCLADFSVHKNRNIRSTPLDGTFYTMIIANKSASSSVYSLSAQNINNSCSNTDGSSSQDNVNINASFMDVKQNPINQIKVSAGESVKFLVHITVPPGTSTEKWCCTQIIANSNCSNYKVSTVLHTLVINSNDE